MRHHLSVWLSVLALVCFGEPAWAAKVGPEFRVNTTTKNVQRSAEVAALSNGGFVVAWTNVDFGSQGFDGFFVLAQRFTANGERAGTEFRVGPVGESVGSPVAVVALSPGGFIIIFRTDDGIRGQRYSGAGVSIGSAFIIPAAESAVGLSGGGFVVTYTNAGSIYGQRYTAGGSPIGSAFLVNPGGSSAPHVAALSTGGFVVTWQWNGQDGSGLGVYGRRYDGAAAPVGIAFRANTFTEGHQRGPSVAGLTNGRFVVTWESNAQDGSFLGIYGQRYSAAGARTGGEFRVNNYTTRSQFAPSVGGITDGGFVVVWTSDRQDGSGFGVYGKRYNSAGMPVSNAFRVNTYTKDHQSGGSVAGLNNGSFVAIWTSSSNLTGDASHKGIWGQRFSPDAD